MIVSKKWMSNLMKYKSFYTREIIQNREKKDFLKV